MSNNKKDPETQKIIDKEIIKRKKKFVNIEIITNINKIISIFSISQNIIC